MIDVNLKSIIHITKHCLPYMIETDAEKLNVIKAILNIGSLSSLAINVGVDRAIYVATKHSLKGFSDCLFCDVREHGIKVCCIMPVCDILSCIFLSCTNVYKNMDFAQHFINTEMIAKIERNHFLLPHLDELIQPSDIAQTIDYILGCSPHACPTEIVIKTQKNFL